MSYINITSHLGTSSLYLNINLVIYVRAARTGTYGFIMSFFMWIKALKKRDILFLSELKDDFVRIMRI